MGQSLRKAGVRNLDLLPGCWGLSDNSEEPLEDAGRELSGYEAQAGRNRLWRGELGTERGPGVWRLREVGKVVESGLQDKVQ